jgi:hypothetical protein
MDDQVKMAFEFASDLSKQLITLSTGIIALTITFAKDILGPAKKPANFLLLISWICYLLSIVFGIWCLMALTGTLAPIDSGDGKQALELGFNVRLPSSLQIITFIVATSLVVVFGGTYLRKSK